MPLYETIRDLETGQQRLRARRYGVIRMRHEAFDSVLLRPYPKIATLADVWWGNRHHENCAGDACWLYYNQPWGFDNFLALRYIVTSQGTSYAMFRGALRVLDYIARVKGSDALLCDVSNARISDRLLKRLGWEPHKPSQWHRNFIKRFYGEYPKSAFQLIGRKPRLA